MMSFTVYHFPDPKRRAVELDLNTLPPGIREFVERIAHDTVADFEGRHPGFKAREVIIAPGKVWATSGLGRGAVKEAYSMMNARVLGSVY